MMTRTVLYLKIELDALETEEPSKIAAQICRQVSKIYGVRTAEIQNMLTAGD